MNVSFWDIMRILRTPHGKWGRITVEAHEHLFDDDTIASKFEIQFQCSGSERTSSDLNPH